MATHSNSRPCGVGAAGAALGVGSVLLMLATHCSGRTVEGTSSGSAADASPQPPVLATAPPDDAGEPRRQPNIVFVLTDDLSTDLVPYMPHVLDMERRGTSFSRYFVTDSLCCPSRASIFTGAFPHNTGVYNNTGDAGGYETFQARGNATHTFATALHDEGYATAMMGKYLNGYNPFLHGADPGWSQWAVSDDGYRGFDYWMSLDGVPQHYGTAPNEYLTDVVSSLATRFISAAANGPFAVEIATFAPHEPSTPAPQDIGRFAGARVPRTPAFATFNTKPPRWLADLTPLTQSEIDGLDYRFRRRVESVQAVDRMLGEIMAALVDAHVANDTYVFFSSDNGYHLGEHMLLWGKESAFDTDIRVPLVVVGPGVPAGAIVNDVTENVDLCPTFSELAGGRPLDTSDGHSLVGLLHGAPPEPDADWRHAALVEHRGPALRNDPNDPDRDTVADQMPSPYEALRMETALYVEYGGGETEYYDLLQDPHELSNTAASLPPARVRRLHEALTTLRHCHGPGECWRAQHEAP